MKTIANLTAAFVGESCARNFYDFAAGIARKEGFLRAAQNFEKTAIQENQHAKWLAKMAAKIGGAAEFSFEKEIPKLGTTAENLRAAIGGENFEHEKMYPEFARIAREENLPEIADRLLAIAEAEKNHERRFREILQKVENGETGDFWECQKCGYFQKNSAPEKCPSCDHPESWFFART